MLRHVKHPFPAVVDSESKILVLGSVPSVKSVEHDFYYMHPQNRFWRVLSRLFGQDFTMMSKQDKIIALCRLHIALYDSVEECDILSSKDSAISNVVPADIRKIMQGTKISRIFCNGKASYAYLVKYHPDLAEKTLALPSTSPANAQYSLEKLTDEWKVILDDLN